MGSGQRLERGQGLSATSCMPDIVIATILLNALHNRFNGVNLIWPHHQKLFLAGDDDHVTADHLPQGAFRQEILSKTVKVDDLFVVLCRKLINRQKLLVGIEAEMACVIVCEVPRINAIADNEKLDEAKQRFAISAALIVLVLDNLLHRPARADGQSFQLDLDDWNTIDEQDYIVAVMAVVRVDAKLIDDLKAVLAPVTNIHQSVVEWRPVIAFD